MCLPLLTVRPQVIVQPNVYGLVIVLYQLPTPSDADYREQ